MTNPEPFAKISNASLEELGVIENRKPMAEDLVVWSSDLSVAIPEVDEQHKHLVDLLNRLNRAIQQHRGSEESRRILQELAEYTSVHFATEERLMLASNYPSYDSHKTKHDDLIQQVVALQERVDSGKAKISFELLHFLKNWLTQHIQATDKHFGDYFLQSGTLAPHSNERQINKKQTSPWWRFW